MKVLGKRRFILLLRLPTALTTSCRESSSSSQKDYYKVLNIEKNSTRKNIKQAYYKLSKQYHPDVNDEPNAEAKFKEIQEAYHVLGDDIRKNAYDLSINESGSYYDQRQPFNKSGGGGYRPNAGGEQRRARHTNDFNEYYKTQYGDKSRPYTNYGPNGGLGKVIQVYLNRSSLKY